MSTFNPQGSQRPTALGIDRSKLRLLVLGAVVIGAFVILFSRLWFLQVLASEDYLQLAKENRVRKIESEPPRGRILDRNGEVLVANRSSLAVAIERDVVQRRQLARKVLRRLSDLLDIPVRDMQEELEDVTVSPYKPIAVAYDVEEWQAIVIRENGENFPGVTIQALPIRTYPQGKVAAQMLGYVGEIREEQLKDEHFKDVRPPYRAGDIVGQMGVEYTYDRWLRGKPGVTKVVVNSTGQVVRDNIPMQDEEPGHDLYLSLDASIQEIAEDALKAGVETARAAGYGAPGGGVAILDPNDGHVIALASQPTYDPGILADGITQKEWDKLGQKTPNNPDDDALFFRPIQGQRSPGSTFKPVTAGAALANDVADVYTQLDCPGAKVYPPGGGPGSTIFRNWTSTPFGYIGFPTSLEISCDTFYYELGWMMDQRFGPFGDKTERFQKYARTSGFGHDTGIDLPNEEEGRVPDIAWCKANKDIGYCPAYDGPPGWGWVPGYSVNMAIGQGDLIATPLQMAVAFAAIANGGTVWEPRVGMSLQKPSDEAVAPERSIDAKVAARLPLDDAEIATIREGLGLVVVGGNGTARGAFSGFPLETHPIAGKTGTAQLTSGEGVTVNDAWFISYAPADDPRYVIAVYVEEAGHGGTSAAPIARQIWEGIFGIDRDTNVRLGTDLSG